MRLIDADELKKEWGKIQTLATIIDNAPTVEFPEQITIKCDTEEDKQKLLSAFRNAKLKVLVEEERPTGKWIYSETEYDFVCSECGEKPVVLNTYDTPNITDLPNYQFCRNCGAKMRVKDELEEAENENV